MNLMSPVGDTDSEDTEDTEDTEWGGAGATEPEQF
jgi:hypothetical protein